MPDEPDWLTPIQKWLFDATGYVVVAHGTGSTPPFPPTEENDEQAQPE